LIHLLSFILKNVYLIIRKEKKMENLAGETKADLSILKELSEAGIEIVEGKKSRGEVPYTLTGRLADWTFSRAWYYWVARAEKGLPLKVAAKLYKKHGKVVRVEGHCGCPPPEEWLNGEGRIDLYHVDSQEGLNALASVISNFHNLTSTGNNPKKILELYDKISTLYTEWETTVDEEGIEWFKKMPTILYGDGRTVNELIVAIKNNREVVSIAKIWEKDDRRGIAQHFFKSEEIVGFNYGMISGPGQISNREPEVDALLRPHYEEIKKLRPEVAESLELCMQALEKSGPEYDGLMTK
jgi:hypothetical protein